MGESLSESETLRLTAPRSVAVAKLFADGQQLTGRRTEGPRSVIAANSQRALAHAQKFLAKARILLTRREIEDRERALQE